MQSTAAFLSGSSRRARFVPWPRAQCQLYRRYSTSPSLPKKDLPPPLPPSKSPVTAKKEYLEARKKTGEDFLQDPQGNLLRLQREMDETKTKLYAAHDKPIWKRVRDRFRSKRHSVINLLCASMAYFLAHRLHLSMKAHQDLQDQSTKKDATISELRALLRSITTHEFAAKVVEATNNGTEQDVSPSWWSSKATQGPEEHERLVNALLTKLQAAIGDEGLEDSDRKEKNLQDIWKENEKRIEETTTEEGALSAALAVAISDTETVSSKKRVFDM